METKPIRPRLRVSRVKGQAVYTWDCPKCGQTVASEQASNDHAWLCWACWQQGSKLKYTQLNQREPIPAHEQVAYNKDFNPDDPENVRAWFNLPVPSNMTAGEWQFEVGRLLTLCGTPAVVDEHARQMLFLGWLVKNGLRTTE